MKKPVSLTVHKNKIESKRKRDLASEVDFGKLVRDNDIRAYAFVGFDSKGRSFVCWDTGKIMPMWGFPGAVEWAIKIDIERSDIEEDWEAKI